jgi:hypothetical protein
MTPIEFPEQNTVWAAKQEGFNPLPAYSNERETISCWRLTFRERIRLLFGGVIWLRQQNFQQKLQGQLLQIETPFIKTP